MGKLLRSAMVWYLLLASALFWLSAWFVPGGTSLEFGHIVRTSTAVAVVLAYASICASALLARRPDRVEQLSLGIVLSWGATVMLSIWSLLYRYGGRPEWMLEANIFAYLIFIQILGGVLHITAPGAAGGGIPRRNWIAVGVAVGIASFVGLMLLLYDPDARFLVNILELYLSSSDPH